MNIDKLYNIMHIIAINGYKSFIAKNFIKKYKKKYKIIHYKKDINNLKEFKKFSIKNKFSHLKKKNSCYG